MDNGCMLRVINSHSFLCVNIDNKIIINNKKYYYNIVVLVIII